MITHSCIVTLIVCAAALTIASPIASAGPLAPPAGPVLPTMKTLDEVEPRIPVGPTTTPGNATSLFVISQPGSYYLTGNVTGVPGKNGIEITSGGVSLDLMGFDLNGVFASGSLNGVLVSVAVENVQIVNGSVRQWGADGIRADNARHSILRDLTVRFNLGSGLVIGPSCVVERCSALENETFGIITGGGSAVMNCSTRLNTGSGFAIGNGSTVTNCSAFANGGNGIQTGGGSTVTGCSASFNDFDGIFASDGVTISGCSTFGNKNDGIQAIIGCLVIDNSSVNNGFFSDGAGIHLLSDDNRVEGNNVALNDRGIDVDFHGNLIIRNSASGNTVNYDIVANNVFGPILDRTTPASAAVNGSVAPSSIGTTDPWANISY